MTQARQLVDQGFIILGPLVQENDSLSFNLREELLSTWEEFFSLDCDTRER
jgi:hypothetical protein